MNFVTFTQKEFKKWYFFRDILTLQTHVSKVPKGASISHVDMEGGSQISISLHKPYLVKLSTNGRVKNIQKRPHSL